MRDVIVIGAGGGGPVIAKELAAKGLDVLMIEAGPRFANPEQEWSRYDNDANNVISGYFRVGPPDRDKASYPRALPQPSYVWQVAGVGGTTLHYYGNYPRAVPGVFEGYSGADASNYDREHRFPFTFDTLTPYYEWVEELLPVQTAAMGLKERRYFDGCEGIGLPVCTTKVPTQPSFRPQENAILQPQGTAGRVEGAKWPDAQGCTFCGHCLEGCIAPVGAPRNQKAKRSTDNTYVPMALTADVWAEGGKAAEIVSGAYVQKIHTDGKLFGTPTATGVTYEISATNEKVREEAKIVVLAGGAVESPRLWKNSGLPDPNGWVGRGLTDHHFDFITGIFDDETGSSIGASSAARCDFPGYGGLENTGLPSGVQAFSNAFSDSGFAGGSDNGSPVGPAGADMLGRLAGKKLLDAMSDVNKLLNVLVLTDDDVEAQNRVDVKLATLSDDNGKVPTVTMNRRKRSARTKRNREFLAGKAVDLLRAAGAKSVVRMDWPPLILHSHSTMRMGVSASNSVCDEWAKARAVDNLYLADNSMLANSLGGNNPTNTTQAIATRTAERIFTEHFGGDPWVQGSAPIRSTDERITRAVLARGL